MIRGRIWCLLGLVVYMTMMWLMCLLWMFEDWFPGCPCFFMRTGPKIFLQLCMHSGISSVLR
jgi:hypothetical protein